MGKKPAPEYENLEASIRLRCIALACVQERQRLLELLKTNSAADECKETFDVALLCLGHLELLSRDIQLALVRYGTPTV